MGAHIQEISHKKYIFLVWELTYKKYIFFAVFIGNGAEHFSFEYQDN